jgi:hypothetical protein
MALLDVEANVDFNLESVAGAGSNGRRFSLTNPTILK